jgi:hypothetical protein
VPCRKGPQSKLRYRVSGQKSRDKIFQNIFLVCAERPWQEGNSGPIVVKKTENVTVKVTKFVAD